MARRLCALLMVLAPALLLGACGNRGPLFLPDQDPATITADEALEATDDEADDDPRRRTSDSVESDWP